jgi:hypothetical protein
MTIDKFAYEKLLGKTKSDIAGYLFELYKNFMYPEELYQYEEIFPKVLIYKNMFDDPTKIVEVLKRATDKPEDSYYFKDWQLWGGNGNVVFGQYISLLGAGFDKPIETAADVYKIQEELFVVIQAVKAFFAATNHFIKKYDIKKTNNWTHTPPNFCQYIPTDELHNELFMQFHTDYVIEQASEPGDKFAITTTMYFNDDYRGGEILFKLKGEIFSYKPKAGDLLVFPSGHPSILMEGENPIMHAVNPVPVGDPDRYIVRMFHQIQSDGDDVKAIIKDNIEKGSKNEK